MSGNTVVTAVALEIGAKQGPELPTLSRDKLPTNIPTKWGKVEKSGGELGKTQIAPRKHGIRWGAGEGKLGRNG